MVSIQTKDGNQNADAGEQIKVHHYTSLPPKRIKPVRLAVKPAEAIEVEDQVVEDNLTLIQQFTSDIKQSRNAHEQPMTFTYSWSSTTKAARSRNKYGIDFRKQQEEAKRIKILNDITLTKAHAGSVHGSRISQSKRLDFIDGESVVSLRKQLRGRGTPALSIHIVPNQKSSIYDRRAAGAYKKKELLKQAAPNLEVPKKISDLTTAKISDIAGLAAQFEVEEVKLSPLSARRRLA